LASRQNDLAVQQAQLQVQKWKDTKALVDSIVETATGTFFEPPEGFPQIHVKMGDINIDNRDQSTINMQNPPTTGGGTGVGHGPGADTGTLGPGPGGGPKTASLDSFAYDLGSTATRQGFRDI
jgi:hypothetical protein